MMAESEEDAVVETMVRKIQESNVGESQLFKPQTVSNRPKNDAQIATSPLSFETFPDKGTARYLY
jgi:hypothetical protein